MFLNLFTVWIKVNFNKSGIGLGLAIVEDIVNSHGGNVQLSKSNKGGLCVKVSLPF